MIKVYISLPKKFDKEEVKLFRIPAKKRQKIIKVVKEQ